MRSLQDAMYNWLSIKVVCDARPEDTAAMETEKAFYRILEEEYQVSIMQVRREEEFYFISYKINNEEKTHRYPRELIDCILDSINENPQRYKNYEC